MSLTNLKELPLPLAVWLAGNEYDYHREFKKYLSATTLLKPLKSTILGMRVSPDSVTKDVSDFLATRRGTAIHDSIEKTWTTEELRTQAMRTLGMPDNVIARFKVNSDEPMEPGNRYVSMEQRAFKECNGWTIGGQYDFVKDGQLYDFKTTSTYAYTTDSHDKDYQLQGSIYRWLNPDLIKNDTICICFIFMDWSRANAEKDKDYPQIPAGYKYIPLLSIQETEKYISDRINIINEHINSDEEYLPECTQDELWQMPSTYKIYKDSMATRALKVFDTPMEAYQALPEYIKKYPTAFVKKVEGYVKRCAYCPAFEICKQKDKYKIKGINC